MIDTAGQFVRFCIVGGSGLLINLAITHFGVTILGWWYFWAYLVATLISWSCMFLANAFFTFPHQGDRAYPKKYIGFMLGYGGMFFINSGLVYVFTSNVGIYYMRSIVLATVVTTGLTFAFSKYVIYKS